MFTDEFSLNMIEAIDNEVGNQLEIRKNEMKRYHMYGPPDLCYLIKEKKVSSGFSSKLVKQASFHHIYGFDTQSAATIAAYIFFLSEQIDKRCKITQGIFCCYDFINKVDVRVHVTIPGGIKSYTIDESGNSKSQIDWQYVFLSSSVRSFVAEPVYVAKVLNEVPTPQHLNDLLCTALKLYKFGTFPKVSFDLLKCGPSYLLYEITQYLVK